MFTGFVALVNADKEFLMDGTFCPNFDVMFERLLEIAEKGGRTRTLDEYLPETYNEFSSEMSTATRKVLEYVGWRFVTSPIILPDGTRAPDALAGFAALAIERLRKQGAMIVFIRRGGDRTGPRLFSSIMEQQQGAFIHSQKGLGPLMRPLMRNGLKLPLKESDTDESSLVRPR